MNQKSLQYASTQVLDQDTCLKHFSNNTELVKIINASMLCTWGSGKLNDHGALRERVRYSDACISRQAALRGAIGRMVSLWHRDEDFSFKNPRSYYFDLLKVEKKVSWI